MRLIKQKILGIGVTKNSKKQILEYIEKYLDRQTSKPLVIATPNPEQVVLAQKDRQFRQLLNGADVAIPDGIGLAWAIGVPKISGVSLMEELVYLAAKRADTIGLIGGRGAVAVAALECLRSRFPGLNGWAVEPEEEDVVKKIKKTKPKMIFVGLGAPKQEYFIENVKCPLVLMSVGGAFDELSGRLPRPPAIIDRLGGKWLWRLVHEPWRWKRQLSLIRFVLLVFAKKPRVV